MKRFLRYIFGLLFILLGITGLFLPLLQGILFILIGLIILAPESKTLRKLKVVLRKKYPAIYNKSQRLKRKFTGIFRKKHTV